MRFAVFSGEDGRSVYVNPRNVTFVREWSEKLSEVYFSSDTSLRIPIKADLVIADIEKAGF